MSKSTAKGHAQTIWCMRLRSALRTAFACAIVGGATLDGPKFLVNQIKFAALSYVIVVLILSKATTLGHALSGTWHTFYATIQVVPLAMLGRWLVAPGNRGGMPVGMAAAVAVATVASFLVALPESTHVTAKRIALGQIALICTEVVISSDDTSYGFMNPLHIAASSILGALASLLALLLPFPGLAHNKVQKLCQVYAENASERMDIYLRAFNSQDYQTKTELILQAKPIAEIGTKLLQSIKILQEGMPWERPWSRYFKNNSINVENILQSFELPIKAMEYSLISSSHEAFPVQILDQEQLSSVSQRLSSQLHKKIEKTKRSSRSDSIKAPQTRDEYVGKNLSSSLGSSAPIQKYESVCFFFSCIDMLLNDTLDNDEKQNERQKTESGITQKFKFWILKLTSSKRIESAIKYSVSLGLSVLLGVILEKENACWAGLMVAISFAMGRQAIFTTANARAQGTAVGSVYGVICCFLFHQPEIRLLAVLPWIVFATFLKHSKMYGQTGGASAAIGALLILGRKNYGAPDEFAIGRLTSVFIGLFCLVLVELLMQPVRAATLAKRHLCLTLQSLGEFLKETRFNRKTEILSKFLELRKRQRILKSLAGDAELEPDFWHLPFQSCCYKEVIGCLSNVVNMLYIVMYNLEVLSELGDSGFTARKEFEEQLNYELEVLQGTVDSSLEKLSSIKSQAVTEDKSGDVEAGKLHDPEKLRSLIIGEVLRSSEEKESEDEKQLRLVRCLGAIGFCITSLRKEIDQLETCVKEIVSWENHSSR